ncbi:MAG: tRNA (adenosine(37)-N6)-threonylcarbamoyltransferase complex ATPase subunit type 1 TsaE [Phycisphaerales bacterium JB039]
MRLWRLTTDSARATADLGEALGAIVRPGDVLALIGPLGAGKTTLTRAIAAGMGLDRRAVSSPTFVVVNEYAGAGGPALVHVDAYRLTGADELDSVDWDRLIDPQADAVVVVEWADRIAAALPGPGRTVRITIEPVDEQARRFAILAPAGWAGRPETDRLRELCGPGVEVTPCPVTGEPTPTDSPTWPFASEKARMADLHRWFAGEYRLSREATEDDLQGG